MDISIPEICGKCGTQLAVRKLKLEGSNIEVKTKYPNEYETKYYLPRDSQHVWIP